MPFLDIADCRLYYEIDDFTDPWCKPETVLMIHGFTESTPAWRAWVPHLARRCRVIRFDQQGFEWWVNLMGGTAIETARVYMRWVSHIDVGATLHEVQCPALVLTTESPRRAYSRSDIEVYREKLPQAEIVALPVDGYHVGATDPDPCAHITLDFLARNRGSNKH